MTLSELRCLRLDGPKSLFNFMSRYQFDLDQMRKYCRERFGPVLGEVAETLCAAGTEDLGWT